ncbi:PLP-dependent transferase [Viridothelium virens]|uniref:PLP-dependent transferase n=1 Tax=Viridothelium virens TaxID=1048519 RepID=A0A6A6GYT7_VIRVR|nr:PLP-dependent transferase [Viridothelium virens]
MDPRQIIRPAKRDLRSLPGKTNIEPTEQANIAEGNVWSWIHEIIVASPVQPVANLGTGFVDFNPPKFVLEAYKEALNNVEYNQYAPITGLPSLKLAVSKIWSPFYERVLNPDTDICICNGAQEALLSSIMAFVRPGDEVILFEPVFELYVVQLKLVGATAVYVPLQPPKGIDTENLTGNDWRLDMRDFKKAVTSKTKAVILNNPHNPLGKVFTLNEIRSIGQICVSHDLLLISDEVYERIAFDTPFTRAASIDSTISARTLTAISLGKLFNATGWRVGFVIGHARLIHHIQNTHAVLAYASSSPTQAACARGLLEAEQNGFWEENRRDVKARVQRICNVLDEIGLPYVKPLGAYFLFVNISKIKLPPTFKFPRTVTKHGSKDWKVCYYMINEIGVASIPGSCKSIVQLVTG